MEPSSANYERLAWRSMGLPAVACVVVVVALTLWAGDVPWGGDDVKLITGAIQANHRHQLVDAGLGGSFGYPYGPIPAQIYQLMAMVSHDPVMLVRIHAIVAGGLTAFALLYLAMALNLSPWLAPMVLVGPFFWFYTRLLWDNPYALPVGALLLASYADYLKRKTAVAFFTAIACAIALPLIHPMTLPLVTAVVVHALWFHSDGFSKHWRGLIVIAICTVLCSGRYVQRVARQIGESPALIPPRPDALTPAAAFAFPMLSGRLLSAYGFLDQRGPEIGWETSIVGRLARIISAVAFVLVCMGILAAIRRFSKGCQQHAQPINAIAGICVATLALQSIMDSFLRISPYPHYYCGTWAVAVVLLWLGLNRLPTQSSRMAIGMMYAVAMVTATVAFAVDIHRNRGGRVWYGPTLQSQIDVARQLQGMKDDQIEFSVDRLHDNPTGVLSLMKLLPVDSSITTRRGHVTVGYDADDSRDCRLVAR